MQAAISDISDIDTSYRIDGLVAFPGVIQWRMSTIISSINLGSGVLAKDADASSERLSIKGSKSVVHGRVGQSLTI